MCPAQQTAPSAHRRRGSVLEDAIRDAAFAELAEVGYTAFAVESVAARAQTGKASIYRRWPTKLELVIDTLSARMPAPSACGLPALSELRDSQTTAAVLTMVAERIVAMMCGPIGDVVRAVKAEASADPCLAEAVDAGLFAPRREALLDVLRRGVARGEVRPEAVTPLVADVLPAMIHHHVVMQREVMSKRTVRELISDVVMPMIEARD